MRSAAIRARELVRAALAVAVVVAAASSPGAAYADAISGPPDDCVEGSRGVDRCHGSPTCEVVGCGSDADCSGTDVCQERALCTREHCCSGRCCSGRCEGHEPRMYMHAAAACDSSGGCGSLDTCRTLRVCVPSPNAPPPAPPPAEEDQDQDEPASAPEAETSDSDGGCSIHPGSRAGSSGPWFVLALLGLGLGRRRAERVDE